MSKGWSKCPSPLPQVLPDGSVWMSYFFYLGALHSAWWLSSFVNVRLPLNSSLSFFLKSARRLLQVGFFGLGLEYKQLGFSLIMHARWLCAADRKPRERESAWKGGSLWPVRVQRTGSLKWLSGKWTGLCFSSRAVEAVVCRSGKWTGVLYWNRVFMASTP